MRRKLQFLTESKPTGAESRRVLIFVGPPGAGKTTTLAKVAIREYLGRRLSMRIISMDPFRVASHEKLRALARIMGVGFSAASSMREFIEAVDESRNKEVLFIDTPGFSGNDFAAARDLADFLSQLSVKEIHMVLPASMRRENLMRCLRQYEMFQPDCLLFTRLDETEQRGTSLSVALESGKPLSFISAGQSIPEDLERASSGAFLDTLFARRQQAATSAA
jgi:flagellar biosynthesis protein FlhF